MLPIVLFCKSYKPDMLRARRLAQSIALHNQDAIPFYMSVPAVDLDAFAECLEAYPCHLVTDEEILSRTHAVNGEVPSLFPSHLFQQLIKLEFWRIGGFENYVWIDSDSYFTRPFTVNTFMHDGVPYTVQHENRDLFEFAQAAAVGKIIDDFKGMASYLRSSFSREGVLYSFGMPPLVWSCKVLRSLNEDYLPTQKSNIYKILERYPCEMHLYGEYLHHSKVIPLVPHGEYFRIYHFAEQYFLAQEQGEADWNIGSDFFGVTIQSNWARLPWAKRPTRERLKRFFRKALRQARDLIHNS